MELVAVVESWCQLVSETAATPAVSPREKDRVEEEVGLLGIIVESRTDVGSPKSERKSLFFVAKSKSNAPVPSKSKG